MMPLPIPHRAPRRLMAAAAVMTLAACARATGGYWTLPGIQIEQGRAYAINEWTRLKGEVTETDAPGSLLNLSGERLSNDGYWYPMAMEGQVYRDRESTLFGYWKGASCEADVTPVQAVAPDEESPVAS
jgi:hypothetical protein